MGVNYSQYGLDDTPTKDDSVARNRAIQASVDAVNAEIQVLIELDDEDRVILEKRRDKAQAEAERLRKEAELTKREIKGYRAQVVEGRKIELAQKHLELETIAKAKEAAGDLAETERGEQGEIEMALETLEKL